MMSYTFLCYLLDEGTCHILAPHAAASGDCPRVYSVKPACVSRCQDRQKSPQIIQPLPRQSGYS